MCHDISVFQLLYDPPVFIELDSEARHGLHGVVGEGQLHQYGRVLAAECTGDLQTFTLGSK